MNRQNPEVVIAVSTQAFLQSKATALCLFKIMKILQNMITNKNWAIIWDPIMWQFINSVALKHTLNHNIKIWMRSRHLFILSAESCKESHSNRPKQMDAPRCRQHLEVPTQPLRSLAALPLLFAGRIRMTDT